MLNMEPNHALANARPFNLSFSNASRQRTIEIGLIKFVNTLFSRESLCLQFVLKGDLFYQYAQQHIRLRRDNFLLWMGDGSPALIGNIKGFVPTITVTYSSEAEACIKNEALWHQIRMEPYFIFEATPSLQKHLKNFKEDCSVQFEGNITLAEKTNFMVCIDTVLRACLEGEAKAFREIKAAKFSTCLDIYQRLQRARLYMDNYFEEPLTISLIARQACMAPNHLIKHFSQYFNESPHQYLIRKRMNLAEELLTNTNLPVADIVKMIGFENASSFTRLFKIKTRKTPCEFRLGIASRASVRL